MVTDRPHDRAGYSFSAGHGLCIVWHIWRTLKDSALKKHLFRSRISEAAEAPVSGLNNNTPWGCSKSQKDQLTAKLAKTAQRSQSQNI